MRSINCKAQKIKETIMANGLDDVVAADTVLSDVDGVGGHLTIRGHSLMELAGRWRYAQVVRLLFDGLFDELPSEAEVEKAIGKMSPGLSSKIVRVSPDSKIV